MPVYTLYYWSAPFRGQFVRAVLAFAGKGWTEAGDDVIHRPDGRPAGGHAGSVHGAAGAGR